MSVITELRGRYMVQIQVAAAVSSGQAKAARLIGGGRGGRRRGRSDKPRSVRAPLVAGHLHLYHLGRLGLVEVKIDVDDAQRKGRVAAVAVISSSSSSTAAATAAAAATSPTGFVTVVRVCLGVVGSSRSGLMKACPLPGSAGTRVVSWWRARRAA